MNQSAKYSVATTTGTTGNTHSHDHTAAFLLHMLRLWSLYPWMGWAKGWWHSFFPPPLFSTSFKFLCKLRNFCLRVQHIQLEGLLAFLKAKKLADINPVNLAFFYFLSKLVSKWFLVARKNKLLNPSTDTQAEEAQHRHFKIPPQPALGLFQNGAWACSPSTVEIRAALHTQTVWVAASTGFTHSLQHGKEMGWHSRFSSFLLSLLVGQNQQQ